MSRGIVLILYNLLLPFALLVLMPGYLLKMKRRGGYGGHFWQRCGLYRRSVKRRLGENEHDWIHAVSVGEVLVAEKFIRAWKDRDPKARIVLSTTTSTGHGLAVERFHDQDDVIVLYNPIDFPVCAWLARRAIRPRRLILTESEIWPNLVWQLRHSGLPVSLINARLSSRSERRYLKFSALTRPIFSMLSRVCVQFESDIDRWAGLGVRRDRIRCVGSIKYDFAVGKPDKQIAVFRNLLSGLWGESVEKRRVLLLGSTHDGEEELLARSFLQLHDEFPDLFLIIVPRHFERTPGIIPGLRKHGLEPVRRSTLDGQIEMHLLDGAEDTRCLLVDTTGELLAWYYLADAVVMGKSFLSTGGQNPAEPIAAGLPVFTGPHMENFRELMEGLLQAGGIQQVADADELPGRIAQVLRSPAEAGKLARRGQKHLGLHKGAAARTVQEIA
jgi:3-deoxy-D-manno-octulosonic-acid transferase